MTIERAAEPQKYRATVELTWSSEVFEGDPDDVFLLAEAERTFLVSVLETAVLTLNPEDASFDIQSMGPVLEIK
jgi:hypothetical protein